MAKAESRSITRRAVVAGSAAGAAVFAACPSGAIEATPDVASAARAAGGSSGLRSQAEDPIHAAIAAHARAYAASEAYQEAEPDDEVGLEPLLDDERAAGEALAAIVPTTLEGVEAALGHVYALHARDDYPMLDDYHCYVLIASAARALRRVMDRRTGT